MVNSVQDIANFNTISELKLLAVKILSDCGTENAAIDVNAALKHIIGCDEIYILTHKNDRLDDEKFAKFKDFLEKRKEHIPLSYILGEKEFMSLKFLVNPSTLIPRPDTEAVAEYAISAVECGDKVLDLCTGSGAIGISCAKYTKAGRILCVDKFEKTLETARKNADLNGVSDVCKFLKADVLKDIASIGEKFDIVVSNPPYIETKKIETLDKTVKDFEPLSALDGGFDGLIFYRKIVEDIDFVLKKGKKLVFEIGYDQAEAVKKIMDKKFESICIKKDFGGNDRVICGTLR